MTPKERIEAAFRKQPTDKVPVHHISCCSQVASVLLGRDAHVGGGKQQWREAVAHWNGPDAHQEFVERSFQDAVDLARVFSNDLVRVTYWRYNRRPTERIDENTFLYATGDESRWQVLRFDPESEQCHIFPHRPQATPTLEDLERSMADQEQALAQAGPADAAFAFERRATELLGDRYAIRVGAVSLGIPLVNTDVWLEAMVLRPSVVQRLLDVQVEQARRNVAFLASRGFRYFFGGLDFASNEGPMYSPRIFHDLVRPRIEQISAICEHAGGYHLFASDGDLWPVANDLFGDGGAHGYYEIDRRAGMDLGRLRERYPDLTLIGNISSHTVHLGSREEVVAETRSCLDAARQYHGIIVGVSNAFVPGTPLANVEAVLETITEHR